MTRAEKASRPPYSEMMFYRSSAGGAQEAPGTPLSKIKTINSGIAANAAAAMRSGVNAIVPLAASATLQKRFARALSRWLGVCDIDKLPACDHIPALTDFRITSGQSFSDRFNVPVRITRVDATLTVCVHDFVPARDVSAPDGTVLLEVVVAVSGCFLNTGTSTGAQVMRIQVPYNESPVASQSLAFAVSPDRGVLLVTGAWLQYYTATKNGIRRVDHPEYQPAGILQARYH